MLDNLRKDFSLYVVDKEAPDLTGCVSLSVNKGDVPYFKIPPVEAALYNLDSICYRKDGIHYVDYMGKGLMIYDFNKEEGAVYGEDENLLYEKARLACLSRIGECLDKRHIHRIHGLGLSKAGRATICLLPMAMGKTTLAFKAIKQDNGIKLLSDDVCMLGFDGRVHPFVLRIGIRDREALCDVPAERITHIKRPRYGDKFLIDTAYFSDSLSGQADIKNILIGKRVFQEKTQISRISKIKCLIPFIESGVFGLGLPQIVELFLKSGLRDFMEKIKLVFSRSALFLGVLCRCDTYEIRIGIDIDKAVDTLTDFINTH